MGPTLDRFIALGRLSLTPAPDDSRGAPSDERSRK